MKSKTKSMVELLWPYLYINYNHKQTWLVGERHG